MSDKYAALRAAAEAATGAHERLSVIPADEIFDISLADATQLDADITALNAFNELANPATMLSLLAEREADKARIAELSESHSKLRDTMAAIHNTIRTDGTYTPLAAILNASKRAHEESAVVAAGITLETGENHV